MKVKVQVKGSCDDCFDLLFSVGEIFLQTHRSISLFFSMITIKHSKGLFATLRQLTKVLKNRVSKESASQNR